MNFDSYYQPPEPKAEFEQVANCRECDADTWHLVIIWGVNGTDVRECQECGEQTDYEEDAA